MIKLKLCRIART